MGMVPLSTHIPDIGQPWSNLLLDSQSFGQGGGWLSEFQTMSCCVIFATTPNKWGGRGGVIIGKYFYSLFTCFCAYRSFWSNKIFVQEKNGNILVGGYPPLIGKRPIYFRFFLMKPSLSKQDFDFISQLHTQLPTLWNGSIQWLMGSFEATLIHSFKPTSIGSWPPQQLSC